MRGKTAANRRAKRARLFRRQGGLCHWCRKPMRILVMGPKAKHMPHDLCTLDHLDDRFSPERGKHGGEYRIVAACWLCNFERCKARNKEVPIETLWERSRALPLAMRHAQPTGMSREQQGIPCESNQSRNPQTV